MNSAERQSSDDLVVKDIESVRWVFWSSPRNAYECLRAISMS